MKKIFPRSFVFVISSILLLISVSLACAEALTLKAGEWICPNCNNTASDNFCNNCGAARPAESTSVSSASNNDDVIGKWEVVQVIYNGVTIEASSSAFPIIFQMYTNGSATITMEDEELEGTWSRNGSLITISSEGDSIDLMFEDGKIIWDLNGSYVYFSRETNTSSVKLPSPIAASSEDQFFGTWNMSRVEANGAVLSTFGIAAMGYNKDMRITITRGEAHADIVNNGKHYDVSFYTSFSNGRLQLKSRINDAVLPAILTDTGEFYIIQTTDKTTGRIYFAKEETGDSGQSN